MYIGWSFHAPAELTQVGYVHTHVRPGTRSCASLRACVRACASLRVRVRACVPMPCEAISSFKAKALKIISAE